MKKPFILYLPLGTKPHPKNAGGKKKRQRIQDFLNRKKIIK